VPDAVIVAACRTAIGPARRGSLVDADPFDLARHTDASAVTRSGLAPELFDEVVLGEALAGGGDIARYAAVQAGLIDVAGTGAESPLCLRACCGLWRHEQRRGHRGLVAYR
jgi:acetyl-CoA acetyltransferase